MSDRQQDGAEPLLAIADAAGRDWPFKARDAFVSILANSDHAESNGTRLLADIRAVFDDANANKMSSHDLATALAAIEPAPWAEWSHGRPITPSRLARMLAPFGIRPHTIRMGGNTAKGYERADFEDAWNLYLSSRTFQSVTTSQANIDAGSSILSKGNEEISVTVSKREIASAGAGCDAATVSSQGEAEEWELEGLGVS